MSYVDGVVTLLAGAAAVVLVGVMHWWRSCPVDRTAVDKSVGGGGPIREDGRGRAGDYPATFVKHAHRKGCDGALFRYLPIVHVDRTGRLGNGGIVAHDYRCNMAWDGCMARVLVTEQALRQIAVAALKKESAPTSVLPYEGDKP